MVVEEAHVLRGGTRPTITAVHTSPASMQVTMISKAAKSFRSMVGHSNCCTSSPLLARTSKICRPKVGEISFSQVRRWSVVRGKLAKTAFDSASFPSGQRDGQRFTERTGNFGWAFGLQAHELKGPELSNPRHHHQHTPSKHCCT